MKGEPLEVQPILISGLDEINDGGIPDGWPMTHGNLVWLNLRKFSDINSK
jgi:hypothetical protein